MFFPPHIRHISRKRLWRHITGITPVSRKRLWYPRDCADISQVSSHLASLIYIYRYIERDCADISCLERDCGDISQVSSHLGCVARLSHDISQVSFHIASLIHLSLSPHMRLFWYTSRGRLCPHITGILSRKNPFIHVSLFTIVRFF